MENNKGTQIWTRLPTELREQLVLYAAKYTGGKESVAIRQCIDNQTWIHANPEAVEILNELIDKHSLTGVAARAKAIEKAILAYREQGYKIEALTKDRDS